VRDVPQLESRGQLRIAVPTTSAACRGRGRLAETFGFVSGTGQRPGNSSAGRPTVFSEHDMTLLQISATVGAVVIAAAIVAALLLLPGRDVRLDDFE